MDNEEIDFDFIKKRIRMYYEHYFKEPINVVYAGEYTDREISNSPFAPITIYIMKSQELIKVETVAGELSVTPCTKGFRNVYWCIK